MRREFIDVMFAKSKWFAKKQAPWAAKITKCWMGYMAFESIDDYKTWKSQR